MSKKPVVPHPILLKIERFMRRQKPAWSAVKFGREAAGDPNLVYQLRTGREPRRQLREHIEKFIAGKVKGRSEAEAA